MKKNIKTIILIALAASSIDINAKSPINESIIDSFKTDQQNLDSMSNFLNYTGYEKILDTQDPLFKVKEPIKNKAKKFSKKQEKIPSRTKEEVTRFKQKYKILHDLQVTNSKKINFTSLYFKHNIIFGFLNIFFFIPFFIAHAFVSKIDQKLLENFNKALPKLNLIELVQNKNYDSAKLIQDNNQEKGRGFTEATAIRFVVYMKLSSRMRYSHNVKKITQEINNTGTKRKTQNAIFIDKNYFLTKKEQEVAKNLNNVSKFLDAGYEKILGINDSLFKIKTQTQDAKQNVKRKKIKIQEKIPNRSKQDLIRYQKDYASLYELYQKNRKKINLATMYFKHGVISGFLNVFFFIPFFIAHAFVSKIDKALLEQFDKKFGQVKAVLKKGKLDSFYNPIDANKNCENRITRDDKINLAFEDETPSDGNMNMLVRLVAYMQLSSRTRYSHNINRILKEMQVPELVSKRFAKLIKDRKYGVDGPIHDILDEGERLNKELTTVKGERDAVRANEQQLKRELNAERERVAQLNAEAEAAKKQLATAQAQQTAQTAEIERLKQELAEKDRAFATVQGEQNAALARVQQLNAESEAKVQELTRVKAALENEKEALRKELTTAQADLTAKGQELTAVKGELDTAKDEVQQLTTALTAKGQELTAVKGELEVAKDQELTTALTAAKDEAQQLTTRLNAAQGQLAMAQGQLKAQIAEIERLKQELAEKEAESKKALAEKDRALATVQGEQNAALARVQQLNAESEAKVQELTRVKAALENEKEALRKELTTAQADLTAKGQELTAVKGELDTAKDEVQQLTTALTAKGQELTAVKGELEVAKDQELTTALTAAKDEAQQLTTRLNAAQGQLAMAQGQLKAQIAEIERLKQELAEKEAESKKALAEKDRALATVQGEQNAALANEKEVQKQLNDVQAKLKKELAAKEIALTKTQEEVGRLKQELAEQAARADEQKRQTEHLNNLNQTIKKLQDNLNNLNQELAQQKSENVELKKISQHYENVVKSLEEITENIMNHVQNNPGEGKENEPLVQHLEELNELKNLKNSDNTNHHDHHINILKRHFTFLESNYNHNVEIMQNKVNDLEKSVNTLYLFLLSGVVSRFQNIKENKNSNIKAEQYAIRTVIIFVSKTFDQSMGKTIKGLFKRLKDKEAWSLQNAKIQLKNIQEQLNELKGFCGANNKIYISMNQESQVVNVHKVDNIQMLKEYADKVNMLIKEWNAGVNDAKDGLTQEKRNEIDRQFQKIKEIEIGTQGATTAIITAEVVRGKTAREGTGTVIVSNRKDENNNNNKDKRNAN